MIKKPIYLKETEKAVQLKITVEDPDLEKTITKIVWVPKSQLAENGSPGEWITDQKALEIFKRDVSMYSVSWSDAENNTFLPSKTAKEIEKANKKQKAFEAGAKSYNELVEYAKNLGIKGIRVGLKRTTIEQKISNFKKINGDLGHLETDDILAKLENKIKKQYALAYENSKKRLDDFLKDFEKEDNEMLKKVISGNLSRKKYEQWRMEQITDSNRWRAMVETLAKDMNNANKTAVDMVNNELPAVFEINANYTQYELDKYDVDMSFTLYDKDTVNNLIKNQPYLLPKVDDKKDQQWNEGAITSAITTSILTGESIPNMSKHLLSVANMNKNSATRTARTFATAAQNAGRQDRYNWAKKRGLPLRKKWLATKDMRTRHEHGMADGQIVELDEPFIIDGYKMMYPGDKEHGAPGHLIYNCRCTTVTVEKDGIEAEPTMIRVKDADGNYVVVEDMTYSEWLQWRNGKKQNNTIEKPTKTIKIKIEPAKERNIDTSLYSRIKDTEVSDFIKESGKISRSEYKKINQHKKANGDLGGYVRSHQAWRFNAKLRTTGEQNLDDDDKEMLQAIRKACINNTTKKKIILDRFVDANYLTEYSEPFNRFRPDLVDNVVEFINKNLIGKTKTEKSIVSTSYGNNVLTDRDIHIRLHCEEGTHLFVTKNKRESEVLFHDGLTYRIIGVDKEYFDRNILNTIVKGKRDKYCRVLIDVYVENKGLPYND